MNLIKKIKKIDKYAILLLLIVVLLFVLNYKQGTFLTGWDNIHSEFDWLTNLKRSLFPIWQSNQGLGTTTGMSYAADLPRTLLLLPLTLVLPSNLIRWVFMFACLAIGPLGMYFLSKKILLNKTKVANIKNFSSFAAGLFYLLNLGTLQNFYTPIEMFTTQYAFLPWLVLLVIKNLEKPTWKKSITLIIVSFVATAQAITPTLFIPYALIISAVFLTYIFSRKRKNKFRNVILTGSILVITNLLWVMPTLFSVINATNTVLDSKISQMVSEDVRLINDKSSTLNNFILLKGFWFESTDLQQNGQITNLMSEWNTHLQNPIVIVIGYLFFIIIILGLIFSLTRRNPYRFVLLFTFTLSAIMLLGENSPIGFLFNALRNSNQIIAEIFRFPFTKFSIIAIFVFSIYFGTGISILLEFLEHIKLAIVDSLIILITGIIVIFCFILYMQPALQGNLIYKNLKVEIPNEYFDMFKWFSFQDSDKRILHLPANTYLGWTYYDWGYRGSGFLWYGIKQPIVDRAFDVWNKYNESVYLEISTAIYTKDIKQFEKLISKYQITYILLDENIIDPYNNSSLFNEEIETFLNAQSFHKKAQFEDLFVYEYSNAKALINSGNPVSVNNLPEWSYKDNVYDKFGPYIAGEEPQLIYPFFSFEERKGMNLSEKDNVIYQSFTFENSDEYFLNSSKLNELLLNDSKININSKKININTNDELKIRIADNQSLVINEDLTLNRSNPSAIDCNGLGSDSEVSTIRENGYIEWKSMNANNCDYFEYPDLDHNSEYLIKFSGQNVKGKKLRIYVQNYSNKRNNIVMDLNFDRGNKSDLFVFLPKSAEGEKGYSINIENRSIGQKEVINRIYEIKIYKIDSSILNTIHFSKENILSSNINNIEFNQTIPNTYSFVSNLDQEYIHFNQSFDPNWKLYYFDKETNLFDALFPFVRGKEVSDAKHFKLNNWANAWKTSAKGNYIISYSVQSITNLYLGIIVILFYAIYLIIAIRYLSIKNGKKINQ